jgi:hypothetical protein
MHAVVLARATDATGMTRPKFDVARIDENAELAND